MLKSEELLIKPFLKWPGGKRWISASIAELLAPELHGCYFEPFLGAGAVFLRLRPKRCLLSDVNKELIRFLEICRKNPEEVVESAWRLSNTEQCYYRMRATRPRCDISWAARFLFLNRTCWGGIYRLNQAGSFNVPFGNSGRRICCKKEVVEVCQIFRSAKLVAHDFEVSFQLAQKGDVVYADPPYTSRGQYNGFIRYNETLFSWTDQIRLSVAAKAARRRGAFIAISGAMHRDVLNLYRNWWVISLERASLVARDSKDRGVFNEAILLSRKPRYEDKECTPRRITDELIESIPMVH